MFTADEVKFIVDTFSPDFHESLGPAPEVRDFELSKANDGFVQLRAIREVLRGALERGQQTLQSSSIKYRSLSSFGG